MPTVAELAKAYKEADQEYQYALASGDKDRLQAALAAKRKAFRDYSKAKKEQMKNV